MTPGTLLFISGLSGSGKSTLVAAALSSITNLSGMKTYTTRPQRPYESADGEYIFVQNTDYDAIRSQSKTWDETVYGQYRYGLDPTAYANLLASGGNVIVSVAPDSKAIEAMSRHYNVKPITIWIDTPQTIASERIAGDPSRMARIEDDTIRANFDIIYEPTNQLTTDSKKFSELISSIIQK